MCGIIQREWHEVEAIYEKAGRKPFQSCNAEIKIYIVCENILFYMCKRYRMPALKDRIYAIAAGGRRYGLLESEVKN